MDPLRHPVLDMDFLGHGDTDGKGDERDQVMDGEPPVAGGKALAQKNDVAGLGVGKYLPAEQIGILQTAGYREKSGSPERFGHLSVKFVTQDDHLRIFSFLLVLFVLYYSLENRKVIFTEERGRK